MQEGAEDPHCGPARMTTQTPWPLLEPGTWAETRRSLHRYAQMLGKLRLALAPFQPNFVFTALALTPRGITTGAIPFGVRSLAASLDVFAAEIVLETSDGRERRIALAAPRTVAHVFAEFRAALAELDIDVALSPVPQEMPDATPLDSDERPAVFEPHDAQRWLAVVTATSAVFDRWRAHFFGRASIQLWWGAFDFALLLFNGKHVEAPADRGYLLKYDMDAEMMNVGFYPGDDASAAYFFGYIYPQPAACRALSIAPPEATWSAKLGEWILPYEAVRASPDPEGAVVAFLDAIYGLCGTAAGWDRAQLRYVPPPLRHAR